jgi:ABC-2 type transport system ATP-binding protein
MDQQAIVARDLTYAYGDFVAVDGINFTLAEGEILGFLGPNGAGKTTTFNMLTGQVPPKSGQALVLGRDIGHHPEKIQAEIGVCFEVTNLYEGMSAAENLRLFARLFGVDGFEPRPLLERVGLAGRDREKVATFSKGMKRRLMVARALVNRPRLLFLDEPTDGLDPASAENIRRIVLEERERGASVFLTTHDMVEADKLSDRVAFINQGRIVAMDTPHRLKQQYGERALVAQVTDGSDRLVREEIVLDRPETAGAVEQLFRERQVVTVHSKEATLEDIFIRMTGRGLD